MDSGVFQQRLISQRLLDGLIHINVDKTLSVCWTRIQREEDVKIFGAMGRILFKFMFQNSFQHTPAIFQRFSTTCVIHACSTQLRFLGVVMIARSCIDLVQGVNARCFYRCTTSWGPYTLSSGRENDSGQAVNPPERPGNSVLAYQLAHPAEDPVDPHSDHLVLVGPCGRITVMALLGRGEEKEGHGAAKRPRESE